jgi:type I restriction enzyme, S subunit
MNAAQVLDHFDRICDAPDAIPRLRRFILDLAVRGKLVEQDPKDEPASELLKQIQAHNGHRIKQGATAKQKSFNAIKDAEIPFVRPARWQWVRLGECLEMINGRAFKPSDWQATGLPIVRIQNLNSENASFNYCDESQVEKRHIIDSQSFLISWSGTPGTSFGAFIWGKGKAALNQHIFKCIQIGEAYFDRFLQVAINGRLDEMIAKAHGGVGLQHITKGKLENLLLPLPPLPEQHRIVAKVDDLLALCDRLEAAQSERESGRNKLTAASLHRLNNGGNADEFREHARFHFRHLSRLTTRPEHIQ